MQGMERMEGRVGVWLIVWGVCHYRCEVDTVVCLDRGFVLLDGVVEMCAKGFSLPTGAELSP